MLPPNPSIERTSRASALDLISGKVVASHTAFGYQWTRPERVILAAPTGVGCWDQQVDIEKFNQGIYSPGISK